MPDQLITERFNQLTPQYQQFITGTFVDHTTAILSQEAGLSEVQKEMFRNAVTLYLLCFLDASGAINFLNKEGDVSQDDARPLIGAVISALPSGMAENQATIYNALNGITLEEDDTIPTTASAPTPTAPTATTPAPQAQPQTETSPVSPVRTMASDMQHAKEGNTYTSSQEDMLNRTESAPTPTSPDDARWQSTS